MAGISCSKFIPVLLILLWVLLDCLCAVTCLPVPGDVHSVYYDFNISSHKQPWCMARVRMDGKDIVSYDCGRDKVISVNLPREEVKATEPWRQQTDMLRDAGNLFKQHLPDIKPETNADRVPFPLQARMTCQRNARGSTSASWEFGWNGQRLLLFEGGKYTVIHPRGKEMKEKWEKDNELTNFLKFTSMGDCKRWLLLFMSGKEEAETAASLFFFVAPGLSLEILQYHLESAPSGLSAAFLLCLLLFCHNRSDKVHLSWPQPQPHQAQSQLQQPRLDGQSPSSSVAPSKMRLRRS